MVLPFNVVTGILMLGTPVYKLTGHSPYLANADELGDGGMTLRRLSKGLGDWPCTMAEMKKVFSKAKMYDVNNLLRIFLIFISVMFLFLFIGVQLCACESIILLLDGIKES